MSLEQKTLSNDYIPPEIENRFGALVNKTIQSTSNKASKYKLHSKAVFVNKNLVVEIVKFSVGIYVVRKASQKPSERPEFFVCPEADLQTLN